MVSMASRELFMAETDIASIIKVINSIENIIKIAEKNPKAFNVDSLRRSRDMALVKLDEAKERYRSVLGGLAAELKSESVTLKVYKS
jgi:hypothetical protein